MNTASLLGPAAVLILWSILVLTWMVIIRLKAFAAINLKLSKVPVGGRYSDIESNMPTNANWISHNYTHLMEQPTLFYAVLLIISLQGEASIVNMVLAWCYVLLRILHSVWQVFYNVVLVRMVLFSFSTLCLLGLALNAVRMTVFA